MTAVQVSPSNGPTEWQEQYREMAENSRRVAAPITLLNRRRRTAQIDAAD